MRALSVLSLLAVLGCAESSTLIGLRPVEPAPPQYRVASLSPLLRWEAWEGEEVRYELRVFEAGDDHSTREIYARDGLPSTEHRLAIDLLPERTYFWTVRAWFRTEAGPRATPWSRFAPTAGYPLPPRPWGNPGGWLPLVTTSPSN